MFATYDRSKVLRCECGGRIGYGTLARIDSQYSRIHVRFDSGVAYRAIIGGTNIATHAAVCPICGEMVYIVDRQMVTTRLYDTRWIARTLKSNKAILGLPAA